jgi:hypothetical protein
MPFEQGLKSTATAAGRALPRVSDVFQTRQQIRAMAGKGAGSPAPDAGMLLGEAVLDRDSSAVVVGGSDPDGSQAAGSGPGGRMPGAEGGGCEGWRRRSE